MTEPQNPNLNSDTANHIEPASASSSPLNKRRTPLVERLQTSNAAPYITIAMCCVAMFLDNLSVSGLVYAQQGIIQRFHTSESQASWTLSAYSLTFGSFLLLSGSAGDVFGHKIIFVSGFALFTLCCLLIATISSSLIGVIIIRAVQGIAAAKTIPTAYALTATSVSGKARESAVVVLGIAQCIGIVAGTILGGVFASTPINYRALFYLSFGLSLLGSIAAYAFIPPSSSTFENWRNLDYIGAAGATISALLLVLGFSYGETGWREARVIAPLLFGGCGIICFGLWESFLLPRWLSSVNPLVPNRVWRYKNLVPILVITSLFYASFYSFQLNGAQFLVRVQNRTTVMASLMFLPVAGGAMIVMPFFGGLYNHRLMPPKYVIAVGQSILLVAILLFMRNGLDNGYWHWTFPSFILTPLGAASFFVNFLNVVFASAPAEEQGLISGIAQMFAQICTALGFSIAGSFITITGTGSDDLDRQGRARLRGQYVDGFYFSLALAGLGALVSLVFVRPIPHREMKVQDEESCSSESTDPSRDEKGQQGKEPTAQLGSPE